MTRDLYAQHVKLQICSDLFRSFRLLKHTVAQLTDRAAYLVVYIKLEDKGIFVKELVRRRAFQKVSLTAKTGDTFDLYGRLVWSVCKCFRSYGVWTSLIYNYNINPTN